ncbi:MAG: two-component sensor histidine kinase, partial [Chloroflexota bacterium]|nr:two-component sensor histidine kinase [Chloroflexota bacterium]
VGLLGNGREASTTAPLPTVGDLDSLVDDFARAGLDVRVKVTGDPTRLSPAAGLDLYRIAQEALANVAKHAPGAQAEVDLHIGEDAATLRIRDHGSRDGAHPLASAAGSGLGIAGMRERAALLGGSLSAQRSGSGWQVECTIPMRVAGLAPG